MTSEARRLGADELYPVAEACGFSPAQERSCLRRMVAGRFFERTRSGRRAVFQATPSGLVALAAASQNVCLAYRQDQGAKPWDGQWRLVALAVPEARRDARAAIRDWLIELGAAGGVSELRVLARMLWPIDDLAARYARFLDVNADAPARLEQRCAAGGGLDDAELIPAAFQMAALWRRCAQGAPLLPQELLPAPWPGSLGREVLLRSRRPALAARTRPGPLALFSQFDESLDVSGLEHAQGEAA